MGDCAKTLDPSDIDVHVIGIPGDVDFFLALSRRFYVMKRFAALITTAALLGAPHSASAAGLNLSALPIGSLVPTVLNVALPVVVGLAPTLTDLHLPVGTLVPVVLNVALPVVTGLAPTLTDLHLPVGTLVPIVLNVALPVVVDVAGSL
jgi:hypothetical protein